MVAYTLLLSRIVPILFWLSFCLVLARATRDFFLRKRQPFAARILFPAVIVFGLVAVIPATQRLYAIVTGERAFARREWPLAATRLDLFRRLGGRMSPRYETHLAMTLINLRLWSDGEKLLASSPDHSDDTVTLLAICRYYSGDLAAARASLASCGDSGSGAPLRHYFLGRIADRTGNPGLALREYSTSLRLNGSLFPAAYHCIRLLQSQNPAAISSALNGMTDAFHDRPGELEAIRAAIAAHRQLPDREFYVILP
jgi:hypothetical protein